MHQQAMGSMPTVNDDGYDAVDEMEMVIDDEDHNDRPTSSTLQATRAPMLRGNQNGADCMMSKLPRGSTMAVDHGGEEAGNKTERVTRSKTGHLPNTFPRSQSDGACGHTTNSTTDHESSYCSCHVGATPLSKRTLWPASPCE